MKRTEKSFVLILLFMLIGIVLTRFLVLTHEMDHHPDEIIFYDAASSLKDHFLHGTEYQEIKEYPEGAYVFQIPFHLLAECFPSVQNAQLWGRIASVFYFCVACVIGCLILRQFLCCGSKALHFYALIMIFSLLHIEQSRYGTGESISFFLLMLLLYATSCALTARYDVPWLMLSGLCVGALGAVKYPQVYFVLIPFAAIFLQQRPKTSRILIVLGCVIGSVLMFSPKAAKDLMYFIRVCEIEMDAYVHVGNTAEIGGKKNHIFALVVYHTLYSDFPLSLPILLLAVIEQLRKQTSKQTPLGLLWQVFIPIIVAVFAGYNLFTATMFFRTLYPYFCICSLYIASIAGRILAQERWKRLVLYALCSLMILRGGALLAVMTDHQAGERLKQVYQAQVCESDGTILLGPGVYTKVEWPIFQQPVTKLQVNDLQEPLELKPGQALLSATLTYARAGEYPFAIVNEPLENQIATWKAFRQANQQWKIFETYPKWIYQVFGYWVKSSTGSEYEFPLNELYYRPPETSIP